MSGSTSQRDDGEPGTARRRRRTPRAECPWDSRPRAVDPPQAYPAGGTRHLRVAAPTSAEERAALALSILRHRSWHPDDARHVEAVVAALLGASIEELLAGTAH